ncbi:hypothetical protein F4775DRAFT_180955 [Biscogniauxia sp. FL1348]|nr:hypothetical protein F4775DRAFT_180955 [Biscogniauxia sp. FL1348]
MDTTYDFVHTPSQASAPLNSDYLPPDIALGFLARPGLENSDGQDTPEFREPVDESDAPGQDNKMENPPPDVNSQLDNFDKQDCAAAEGMNCSDVEAASPSGGQPVIVSLPPSTLTQPRSRFQGFIPPAPVSKEPEALVALLQVVNPQQATEGHIELDLHDFSIYIDSEVYPNELRPLHHLAIRQQADVFYFDGVVSCRDTKFYLERVAFRQLPVGNYGSAEHTVGDQIWIRSQLNEDADLEIYYKLGSPSVEYSRFYTPFLWIANLAKHVIDYCEYLKDKDRRASLHDFKSRFSTWILQQHSMSGAFEKWHSANRGPDFRGAIVANIEYIWKEAHGIDPKITSWHRIWKEIKTFDQYKPNLVASQALSPSPGESESGTTPSSMRKSRKQLVSKTVVTPYIYNLFAHMNFGNMLEREDLSASAENRQPVFLRKNAPIKHATISTVKKGDPNTNRDAFIQSIQPGDVISTNPDSEETGTRWKKETSKHYKGEHLWFGLVQRVRQSSKGKRSFDVIWLYQPMDTPCGIMKYPWENELFLSDNCTCHSGTGNIQGTQILSTHEVEWFGGPSTSAEFFVRQTYLADYSQWTTLKDEHFICGGSAPKTGSYSIGDAVLVHINAKELKLETCIVEGFIEEDMKQYARLRRLLRRREVDETAANAPANEVIFSQQLVEISPKRIARRCLVRAFRPGEPIPAPYNRGGTGNAFFLTHQEVYTDTDGVSFTPLTADCLNILRQSFNPTSSQTLRSQKLQGLDLFCGGGNFGRGLEEGGGVQMRWANDISSEAIHTYMANCEPNTCTPYLGSVDDLLRRAMQGDAKVPRPGEVHFISGGSPCPGFSLLTIDKTTDRQRKNQSLVASFASFIDVYRPYYGLLENVPQMVSAKKSRDACVFSQLVCAVVGLGYQLQIMRLDAWSFGAPQSRSRVFLCFSAPGFRMPRVPEPSHSHPPNMPLHGLGIMSCGRPINVREIVPTPFKFVSAGEAVSDLPDIYDGQADYCVGYPDHRLSIGFTAPLRKQMRLIPTQPYGMNFSKAWYGYMEVPPPVPWPSMGQGKEGEKQKRKQERKSQKPKQQGRVLTDSERELFPSTECRGERTNKNSRGWGRVHPGDLFGTVATTCALTDARIGYSNHWQQHRPVTVLEVRRAQGFPDHEVLLGKPRNQYRIVGNSVARQVALALGLAIREAWFGTTLDAEEGGSAQTGVVGLSAKGEAEGVRARDEELGSDVIEGQWELGRVGEEEGMILMSEEYTSDSMPATLSQEDKSRKRRSLICVEISVKKRTRHDLGDRAENDSSYGNGIGIGNVNEGKDKEKDAAVAVATAPVLGANSNNGLRNDGCSTTVILENNTTDGMGSIVG